jgi:predicted ATPase
LEYVATTLRRPTSDIFPLGAVIQSKTAGNPFYMREMLTACHRKKCIWYDYKKGCWFYDLDKVFIQFTTDKYDDTLREDFVVNRLSELPPASRSILAWASMIGESFSFQLIQRLLDDKTPPFKQDHHSEHKIPHLTRSYSEQDSIKGLQAVIQNYIVVPTQDDDIFRFVHDRYVEAAASLREKDEAQMHFVMAKTLRKYYSSDDQYRNIAALSIHESINIIRWSVVHRQSYRKLLFEQARVACENGVRSTASKLYASCITLLQEDMWSDAEDADYNETLQIYTAAAECYLYTGQYQDAKDLLLSISSNARTSVDKAPAWILQSRVFAQEGDSTSAFQALKGCLAILDVKVDDDPTFPKCQA